MKYYKGNLGTNDYVLKVFSFIKLRCLVTGLRVVQDLRKLNLVVVFWVLQSLHMCVCWIDEKLPRVPLLSPHTVPYHVVQSELELKTYIYAPRINPNIIHFLLQKTDHRNINNSGRPFFSVIAKLHKYEKKSPCMWVTKKGSSKLHAACHPPHPCYFLSKSLSDNEMIVMSCW